MGNAASLGPPPKVWSFVNTAIGRDPEDITEICAFGRVEIAVITLDQPTWKPAETLGWAWRRSRLLRLDEVIKSR